MVVLAILVASTLFEAVLEVIRSRRMRRLRAERDAFAGEAESLRKLARDQLGLSIAGTPRDLLALIDAHRPAGVSLRHVIAELHDHLERNNYP